MKSPPCSRAPRTNSSRDVAPVEAVVGGLDRLLAALARRERLLLGLDQLAQRRGEVGLRKISPGSRRLARLARVRQEDAPASTATP